MTKYRRYSLLASCLKLKITLREINCPLILNKKTNNKQFYGVRIRVLIRFLVEKSQKNSEPYHAVKEL